MGIYCSAHTGTEETGQVWCTRWAHDDDTSHYNEAKDIYF